MNQTVAMEIRIKEYKLIPWKEIIPLQPEKFKLKPQKESIRASIEKHGFVDPFVVWFHKGKYYSINGVQRKDVLIEFFHDAPELLGAIIINAKNKSDAIQILLEVYNEKQSKVSEGSLKDWLISENIHIDEVNFEALDFGFEFTETDINMDEFFEDNQQEKTVKFKIVLEYTEEDYNLVYDALKAKSGTMENAVWQLLGFDD